WCRDVPQCEEGHTPMNTGVSAAAANVTVFAVTKYEQLVPRPKGPPGWQSSAGLREWPPATAGCPPGTQPTQRRALWKIRIHGDWPGHSAGCQLKLSERRVRSGCGIRIVARPSSLHRPAIASVEPLGSSGYDSAGPPSPAT